MPARCLAAGEDNTDVKGLGTMVLAGCRLHGDERQTVGIGEEFLNVFLVRY